MAPCGAGLTSSGSTDNPLAYLRLPVVQDLGALKTFLRSAPQWLVVRYRNQNGLAARVYRHLRGRQYGQWPTLLGMAAAEGLSPSSFRRQLEREGCSFQQIKDEVRRALAFECLRDGVLSVAQIAGGYDAADPYSRKNPNSAKVGMPAKPRLAVPSNPEFFGDTQNQAVFEQALGTLRELGADLVKIDFTPFQQLAEQLYYGSWVAERTVALEGVDPAHINPVVRGIVENGHKYSACDAYKAEYTRAALSRTINDVLAGFDALVVPTSPTLRSLAEMDAEPVLFNSQFGTYTNFTNLADMSALAVPAGMRADGLPTGITLIAPAWHDQALAAFGQRWQQALKLPLGATGKALPEQAPSSTPAPGSVRVAVVGAHLTGMPLNFQLTSRDAVLVEQTTSAATYRLYALPGTVPPKPGLARVAADGAAIIVELWDIPQARFGEFVAEIPAPLGIGNLQLADGRWVKGFICEPYALDGARDITSFGGWRAFIASQQQG